MFPSLLFEVFTLKPGVGHGDLGWMGANKCQLSEKVLRSEKVEKVLEKTAKFVEIMKN